MVKFAANYSPGRSTSAWKNNINWKSRYSELYSSRRTSLPKEDDHTRISFMSNDSNPYASLLVKMRSRQGSINVSELASTRLRSSLMSQQSNMYYMAPSFSSTSEEAMYSETTLLDMVRARSREICDECLDGPLDLPKDDISEDLSTEPCTHGWTLRMTERSASRSRVSRISTKRDMDIPSILAFTTTTNAPIPLEIPAFKKADQSAVVPAPRWSIRRSVCPVCSQKWKDRSSIKNVKYSGLKRNSFMELPSVIAPARLKTYVTIGYVPRPALASVDEEVGIQQGGLRSSSGSNAAWQLTRARKYRAPKLKMLPPEVLALPINASAPLSRKDLDFRVSQFISE